MLTKEQVIGSDLEERLYDTTRFLENFGLETNKVLDPLGLYLRDMVRTDLLTPDDARAMGESLLDAKNLPLAIQLIGRTLPAVDWDSMNENVQHQLITTVMDWSARSSQLLQNAPQIRDHLIRANLRLVVSRARRFARNCGVDLEDRIQDGNIGLIHAVDRWKPCQGAISTYAMYWIKQQIHRALLNHEGAIVRLPVHLQEEWVRLNREFRKRYGRNPTREEILDLGFTETQLRGIEMRDHVLSLSQKLDQTDSDSGSLEGDVPDPLAEPPWIEMVESSQRELDAMVLHSAIAQLDEREMRIVKERFGLNPGIDRGVSKSMEQVGKIFDLSRGRIQQLEGPILKTLGRLVALDIALRGYEHAENYQKPLVLEMRQKAIDFAKSSLDFVPAFIIRALLGADGKRKTLHEIAEYLELPFEVILNLALEARQQLNNIFAVKDKRPPEKRNRGKKNRLIESILLNKNCPVEVREKVLDTITTLLPFMSYFRRTLLIRRFGLNGEVEHSFEQIAEICGKELKIIQSHYSAACNFLETLFEAEGKEIDAIDDEFLQKAIVNARNLSSSDSKLNIYKNQEPEKTTKIPEIVNQKNLIEWIVQNANCPRDIRTQVRGAITRLLPFMSAFRSTVIAKRFGLNGEMTHSLNKIAISLGKNISVVQAQFSAACNMLEEQFETEAWWKKAKETVLETYQQDISGNVKGVKKEEMAIAK